jgi:hypothetical protein
MVSLRSASAIYRKPMSKKGENVNRFNEWIKHLENLNLEKGRAKK